MQEQEIFQHYELKNWELSPRIYKILAASAVFNILLVVVLAQANFLTAKSCDTPLMREVCTVFDALYVGSMILDTDTGYVNEEYVKTELEDADITFIDLSGQTPLEYPSGYFALANPETVTDPTMVVSTELGQNTNPNTEYIPGITGNTTNPTITNTKPKSNTPFKPQVTPKQNSNPTVGKLPGNKKPTITTENQTTQNQTQAQTNTKDETTQNQTVKSDPVKDVTINKQVLKDYGSFVKGEIAKNEAEGKKIDLNQSFKIVAEGPLTKDGKFDISKDKKTNQAKTQITFSEGDPQMVDFAKKAIEAIGDSGVLGYLRNFGAEKVKITLIQDGEKIAARIESDLKDPNKANTMASGLNILLAGAKGRENLSEDEKMLLGGAQKPTSNGSIFIVDFAISKADAQAMINRNLEKVPLPTPTTTNQIKSTAQSEKSNQVSGEK